MSRYGTVKDTTAEYKRIDVRFLRTQGYLVPGVHFTLSWSRRGERIGWIQCRTTDAAVILEYKHRRGEADDWKNEEYPVRVSHTPCNYGGQRPWFHCPARGCGRRVATLYGGAIFACRQCHRLAYESQRERDFERAMRRAQAIQERLGWDGCCVDDGIPDKPKGMHWSTYASLRQRYLKAVSAMNHGAALHFGFEI